MNCGQKIYVKYLKIAISLSTMESKTLPLNLDFTNLLNKKMLLAISHHYIIKLFNETWSYVTFLPLTVKEATPTIQEVESVRPRSPTSASVCKSISVRRCLKNYLKLYLLKFFIHVNNLQFKHFINSNNLPSTFINL